MYSTDEIEMPSSSVCATPPASSTTPSLSKWGDPLPVFPKLRSTIRDPPRPPSSYQDDPPMLFPKLRPVVRDEQPPPVPPKMNRGAPPPVPPKPTPLPVYAQVQSWNTRGTPIPVYPKKGPPAPPPPSPRPPSVHEEPYSPHTPSSVYSDVRRHWSEEEPSPRSSISSSYSVEERPKTIFTGLSDRVLGLSERDFHEFIALNEKTLIMFYNPCTEENNCPAQQLAALANRTTDNKYAFGSVDCSTDGILCAMERACNPPIFKLYSNGFEVSSIREPASLNADQLNMLMMMTPVLKKSRGNIGVTGPLQPQPPSPEMETGGWNCCR